MLCPIGQSNEKPPLQALAKWWEYVTNGMFTLEYYRLLFYPRQFEALKKQSLGGVSLLGAYLGGSFFHCAASVYI